MTDNDIIKALECCVHQHCAECKLGGLTFCIDALSKYSLDLINRQKAENERLQHICAELSKENEEQDRAIINALHRMKVVRAEAIREFAERLRKHLQKRTEYDEGGWDVDLFTVTEEDIDNLVKEMTEEKG